MIWYEYSIVLSRMQFIMRDVGVCSMGRINRAKIHAMLSFSIFLEGWWTKYDNAADCIWET